MQAKQMIFKVVRKQIVCQVAGRTEYLMSILLMPYLSGFQKECKAASKKKQIMSWAAKMRCGYFTKWKRYLKVPVFLSS